MEPREPAILREPACLCKLVLRNLEFGRARHRETSLQLEQLTAMQFRQLLKKFLALAREMHMDVTAIRVAHPTFDQADFPATGSGMKARGSRLEQEFSVGKTRLSCRTGGNAGVTQPGER